MLAYSIRMSPLRYRNAIQFASGHSAQLARSVGQSFSCAVSPQAISTAGQVLHFNIELLTHQVKAAQ